MKSGDLIEIKSIRICWTLEPNSENLQLPAQSVVIYIEDIECSWSMCKVLTKFGICEMFKSVLL
jgi:hypothetical protein